MSDEHKSLSSSGSARGLSPEQCRQAEAYLRRGYAFMVDLSDRLGLTRIQRDASYAMQMAPILYELATYAKGTMGQTILFLQSQGEKGLNPQVSHPILKGQTTRAGMIESRKGD